MLEDKSFLKVMSVHRGFRFSLRPFPLLLLLLWTCSSTLAFVVPTRTLGPLQVLSFSSGNNSDSSQPQASYNDDCFGLVCLGGGFSTGDLFFASIFIAISGCLALATVLGKTPVVLQQEKRTIVRPWIPAAATVVAQGLTSLGRSYVADYDIVLQTTTDERLLTFQRLVCVIAVIIGSYQNFVTYGDHERSA